MPLTKICAMFLWCLFGVYALSDGTGCGHCMEENVLMQMVSLQPNVESSQYHPGRARRFRRFGRFGRYGATIPPLPPLRPLRRDDHQH